MPHIVLLGDSIFDNGAYVSGGPDVVRQLRRLLPHDWRATLCAVDGATTGDVPRQLRAVPADATHLVLSAGDNDALGHVDILDRRAQSWPEVLDGLAEIALAFERRYRALVSEILERDLPLVLCTIYNGSFPEPALRRRTATALVCTEPSDYANPIEPSERGGVKIARVLKPGTVGREPVGRRQTEILIA